MTRAELQAIRERLRNSQRRADYGGSLSALPAIKCRDADIADLLAHVAVLEGALRKWAGHFGPLEDNPMLNEECRAVFAITRKLLGDET